MSVFSSRKERIEAVEKLAQTKILVLDGAMGSLIQGLGFTEDDFRGDRFQDAKIPLKGNNDLLCITQPEAIQKIHEQYYEAGVDIVETNTFGAQFVSQADYGMEHVCYEMNKAAAQIARKAADKFETKAAPKLVAGSIGPTTKLLSMSPKVEDPAYRDINFDTMMAAFKEQIRGLIDGGSDVLLIETITDTLNAKAAIFACEEVFEEIGEKLPIMISGTITDMSGRTLSGQTVEAFYNSVRHAKPWSIGLNCALGPKQMKGFLSELARVAETKISCHPNAGLPNAFGGYDETPQDMCAVIGDWALDGMVNIVGGCCGTTPDHIKHIAHGVEGKKPRQIPHFEPALRLSGLEPFSHS
ncbi:MAG: homocysteine S-methyltransferase family protein [Caulobacterales bacterium]|nr:homocysteine S-methyltransferase family protein [Caulobacterales bacterium]